MEWLILVLLVPLIIIPIVVLCGFVGCSAGPVFSGPPPPSNLSGMADGTSKINLNWTGDIQTNFIVERAPPGGSFSPINNNVTGTTFTDSTVTEGTTFLYQVRAFMPGVGGSPTVPSNMVTVTSCPEKPTNLVATAINGNQIDLSWTNNSTQATSIKIEDTATPGVPLYDGPVVASFPHTGVTPGTTHNYRLVAMVDGVESEPASATATTPTPWRTAYDQPLTTEEAVVGRSTIVQRIDAASLTDAGSKVRVTLRGSTAGDLIITKVTISQAAAAGQAWDSADDLTELLFDGVSGVTIPANTPPLSKLSDGPIYTLVAGKDLIIAFDIGEDGYAGKVQCFGPNMYSKEGVAEAGVSNRTGAYATTINWAYIVEKIEVL